MYEARTSESEFTQQELKNQLRESHNSANELANRVEALLSEKEALKRVRRCHIIISLALIMPHG